MQTLHGINKVPHFDAKADADATFRELGVPTTFFLTPFFWDNFIYFGMKLKRGPGRRARHRHAPELIGKTVGVAGDHVSGAAMAAAMSRALGEEVAYHAVPPARFRGFGFPGADNLGNIFQYKHDNETEFRALRDVGFSQGLYPGLQNFAQCLDATKGAHPDRLTPRASRPVSPSAVDAAATTSTGSPSLTSPSSTTIALSPRRRRS